MTMVASRWRIALITLLLVVMTTGCEWVPVRRRIDPSLYPIPSPKRLLGRSSQEPANVSSVADQVAPLDDETLPPLPRLAPLTDEQALALPAETPLLDAALVRAQDIRELALSGFDEPDPEQSQPPKRVLLLPDTEPAPEPPPPPPASDPEPLPLEALPFEPLPDLDRPLDPPPPSELNEPEVSLEVEDERERADAVQILPAAHRADLWQTVVALLAEPVGSDRASSGTPADPDAGPRLRIADVRLCREVAGFGEYQELDPNDFRAGQWAILYCEVEGVAYHREEDFYRSCLSSQLELSRADGEPLWSSSWMAPETCSKPRRDYFVSYPFQWPATLSAGSYQLRLTHQDLSTNQEATRLVPVTIQP